MNIEQETRRQLAAAYRLVYHYGWDDLIYTHISAKIPGTEDFLINQFGLMFHEISASNLVKVNLAGEVLDGAKINPAGFLIHSAIHASRPDVECVIHTHTTTGVAVSIDKDGLWPISQTALTVIDDLAYHDYYGLALQQDEKLILQRDLGSKNFMILRNHGLLTVGLSIGQAFLNMRRLQGACDIQVLCNKNDVYPIKQDIINSNRRNISMLNKHSAVAWQALVRLVDQNYSDYKN